MLNWLDDYHLDVSDIDSTIIVVVLEPVIAGLLIVAFLLIYGAIVRLCM